MCAQIVDLQQYRDARERERRKLDPKRQQLVRQFLRDHPEWGPKEIEHLHQELEAWGE
jgi:hypothetical protein